MPQIVPTSNLPRRQPLIKWLTSPGGGWAAAKRSRLPDMKDYLATHPDARLDRCSMRTTGLTAWRLPCANVQTLSGKLTLNIFCPTRGLMRPTQTWSIPYNSTGMLETAQSLRGW